MLDRNTSDLLEPRPKRSYGHNSLVCKLSRAINTVSCHASGPPKRHMTKLLRVKMKLNSDENCIGLKFSPLLIIEANFSTIGQLLYKLKS